VVFYEASAAEFVGLDCWQDGTGRGTGRVGKAYCTTRAAWASIVADRFRWSAGRVREAFAIANES
jgi:hypothetical protein